MRYVCSKRRKTSHWKEGGEREVDLIEFVDFVDDHGEKMGLDGCLEELKLEHRADLKRESYFVRRNCVIVHDKLRVDDVISLAIQSWIFESEFVLRALLLKSLCETMIGKSLHNLSSDLISSFFDQCAINGYGDLDNVKINSMLRDSYSKKEQISQAAQAFVVGHEIGHLLSDCDRKFEYIISDDMIDTWKEWRVSQNFNYSNEHEVEADIWAIALLNFYDDHYEKASPFIDEDGDWDIHIESGLGLAFEQFSDIAFGLVAADTLRLFLDEAYFERSRPIEEYTQQFMERCVRCCSIFFKIIDGEIVIRSRCYSRRDIPQLKGAIYENKVEGVLKPLLLFMFEHQRQYPALWTSVSSRMDFDEIWDATFALKALFEKRMGETPLTECSPTDVYLPNRPDDFYFQQWMRESRRHVRSIS